MPEKTDHSNFSQKLASVEQLLTVALPSTDYIDVQALASADLVTPEARKQMADELRAKRALLVAPRIYAFLNPIGRMMLSQYGPGPFIEMPSPHRTALALCRQHGWEIGIPLALARFLLCLSERPSTIKEFPYDQPEARKYDKAGVDFFPMDPKISRLSPAGQSLALALPKDASEELLKEIGLMAARGSLGTSSLFMGLIRDQELGFLNERELVVAETIASNSESTEIAFRAPVGWVPPDDEDSVPFVDQWWIRHMTQGNYICLAAHVLSGHPHLGRGNLAYSSPLIWIDERLGWARTVSRIYRLGRKWQ